MDSEDRDHFKTLALALPKPSTGGSSRLNNSASRLDPASCLKSAKLIAGCYRRDEAQNPELFADAVALVLGDYPPDIVQMAADPRTGIIERFPMGLPNVGQIKQFLDDLLARRDRLQHYAALPKMHRHVSKPVKAEPNLFVPSDTRHYEAMLKRRAADTSDRSRFDQYLCADGVTRNGIWVPLDWYEQNPERPAKFKERFEEESGAAIAGQPLSRELAEKMGINHERASQSAAPASGA